MSLFKKNRSIFLYVGPQEGFVLCLILLIAALLGSALNQQEFFPQQSTTQHFSSEVQLRYGKNYRERQLYFIQDKTLQVFKCNSFQQDVCLQDLPIRLHRIRYTTISCQRNHQHAYWNAHRVCLNVIDELQGTTLTGRVVVIKNDEKFVQQYRQRLDFAHQIWLGLLAVLFIATALYAWICLQLRIKTHYLSA